MSGDLSLLHRAPRPPVQPAPGRLDAISVLDEFTHRCFADEINLWPVNPVNATTDWEMIRPDLLFVESAWSGNGGRWRYQLTGPTGPKGVAVRLVEAARQHGVPSVFWNKEDPPHFEDFLPYARQFDLVLTTEGDLLAAYRENGVRAEVLQFAAAPSIHHPVAVPGGRRGGVCFAGQYFTHKYPERREQMDLLFAAASNVPFVIFSRAHLGNPNYQFPDRFAANVRPGIPYSEMTQEYKRHKVFLNVNSVPHSQTMCARRIFELAACKTPVVSTPSPAISAVFGPDEVVQVEDAAQAERALGSLLSDDLERRRMGQRAWRRVARSHLYRDRMALVCRFLGLDWVAPPIRLCVVVTASHRELEREFQALARQSVSGLVDRFDVMVSSPGEAVEPAGASHPFVVSRWEGRLPAGTTHVASWRAQDDHCDSYLLDHLLMLSRFAVGPVTAKAEWGAAEGEASECRVSHVRAGSWAASAPQAERLLRVEADGGDVIPVEAYASDPFGLRRPGDRAPERWWA